MLPAVVPKARIWAYNYDSKWHADAPQTRLQLCGEDLIRSIYNVRRDMSDRPVIFIGHSLGGLVIQHVRYDQDNRVLGCLLTHLRAYCLQSGRPKSLYNQTYSRFCRPRMSFPRLENARYGQQVGNAHGSGWRPPGHPPGLGLRQRCSPRQAGCTVQAPETHVDAGVPFLRTLCYRLREAVQVARMVSGQSQYPGGSDK